MKKQNLILLALFINISVLAFAQETDTAVNLQKPSKEDFYFTWTTKSGTGLSKYSFEITFLNESSYILINTGSLFKTKQNFIISRWEEAVNTYTDTDEYPYGYKIFSKEDNNKSQNIFSVFINADKSKYLSVIVFGDYIQSNVYTKK